MKVRAAIVCCIACAAAVVRADTIYTTPSVWVGGFSHDGVLRTVLRNAVGVELDTHGTSIRAGLTLDLELQGGITPYGENPIFGGELQIGWGIARCWRLGPSAGATFSSGGGQPTRLAFAGVRARTRDISLGFDVVYTTGELEVVGGSLVQVPSYGAMFGVGAEGKPSRYAVAAEAVVALLVLALAAVQTSHEST